MTVQWHDMQKDYEEFTVTGFGKTQRYKVRYNAEYRYWDDIDQATIAEACKYDPITGKTTRYRKDGYFDFCGRSSAWIR